MPWVEQGSGTQVADVTNTDVFHQVAAWMASEPWSEKDYLEVSKTWDRGVFEHVIEHASDQMLKRLETIAP